MIRKIQITNDLLDVIKSCPSGVIDDIYKIEYYIQGFDTVYEAKFTKEGDCLKVVLPSSELEKLENGILMRRAYYKVSDSSYPDGYYNLTFEDNMNVWLGGESSDPYERQYVTEKDLNKTLEDYALKTEVPSLDGYATQQWVESKGYLTSTGMSGLATQSWVSSNFLSTTALNGYATQSWVNEQGYVTAETLPEGIATESWVQSWVNEQGYLTSTGLSGLATQSWVSSQQFATESWVSNQGYITSVPDTFATKTWVTSQGYLTEHQDLTGYALKSEIPSLDGYATQSWVSNQGYITSVPDTFATKTWVTSQGFLTEHQDLSSYALKSDIPSLDGYATESWVSNQGYITSVPDTFATKNWVSAQGYLTEHQDLTGYATESWVEEINNTKENKKPIFYIDVDFDGPAVLTSYNDYLTIGAQIKQLGVENVVLYVRDRFSYICIPDVIETDYSNNMTITGIAYSNYYRISNDSSSLFLSFNSFVGYTQLENKINDVQTWVVNQNYAKKTELKTINGQSIVGSGDITIQATGGVTEEWLQNNLKTINGVSVVGPGDLFAPETVYININLDSGELIGTYDDYKAVVSKYWENSDALKLVVYLESPSRGVWYDSYPSDVFFPADNTIEIGGCFLDERDENNKRLVYYRIKGNDATQKIELTLTPVSSGGDIPSLDGYATQEWVISQGYITSIPDTYATKTWVSSQGYLTSHQDLSSYALKSEIPSLTGYATQSWVSEQGYLTSHQDLSSYALKSEIPSLTGYATQSWVTSQGYTTQTYVDDKIGQIDTLLDQMLG